MNLTYAARIIIDVQCNGKSQNVRKYCCAINTVLDAMKEEITVDECNDWCKKYLEEHKETEVK